MPNDDLPHEVILSIQRILELEPSGEVDRLDGLSEKFNTVEILNDFFPDGSSLSSSFFSQNLLKICMLTFSCSLAEASLAHLEVVNSRLAETQQELQKEVDALQSELKISQDPERMSVIQEMISVGILINRFSLYSPTGRTYWVKCLLFEKRQQSQRQL
jgi:vacuolar protein sorting-associated protein 53